MAPLSNAYTSRPVQELALPAVPWPFQPHVHAEIARSVEALIRATLQRREHAADAFATLADSLRSSLAAAEAGASGRGDGDRRSDGGADDGGNSGRNGQKDGVGATQPESRLGPRLIAMRNYVLRMLVTVYGGEGALQFCCTFLEPSRWRQLRRVCFK